jgi:7-carboxy-7-deazaguanine synthase
MLITLPVVELFSSLEGEGLFIGTPTIFLRTAGCNVGCRYCDSKQTWDKKNYYSESIDEICYKIRIMSSILGIKRISITGGEPLLYGSEILALVKKLKKKNYIFNLETSGTIFNFDVFELFSSISLDIKTPSSGVFLDKDILRNFKATLDVYSDKIYIKAAVSTKDDLAFVVNTLNPKNLANPLIFTPCEIEGKLQITSEEVISFMKDYPKFNWRFIAQQHKLLDYR